MVKTLMSFVNSKKKIKTGKKTKGTGDGNNTVQEWLPFRDISGGVIHRADGSLVAVLRVMPYNFALKSENQKRRIIKTVHEAFNGQREPLQVLSLGRPVDLDTYLRRLERLSRETTSPARKKLLQEYLRYVAGMVTAGEALERRYYILLPHRRGDGQAREELLQRAFSLKGSLEAAGLDVNVCDEQDIIDLVFCFTHPAQAAFERPPGAVPNVSTIFYSKAEVMKSEQTS